MSKKKGIETALENIDSDFIKALTEPARIEILKLLLIEGGCDIQSLAEKMPQDRSVISRHLSIMERAGLLQARKEGRHVIYSVDGKSSLNKAEQLVASIRKCMTLGCC